MDIKKLLKADPNRYSYNLDDYIKSRGFQKMWNYFSEITKTDYFRDFIKTAREKYGFPENGIEFKDSYSVPPHDFTKANELRNDIIEKICKKYRLHYADYSDVIEEYIYYNELHPIYSVGVCGLFLVSDVISEKKEPDDKLFQESDDMAFPISIRISPYASQRDLVDFVKNKAVWKRDIQFLQDKYKTEGIKIGKVKSKNKAIQERNEFIYENRHLPRKEIMNLVNPKFGSGLAYEDISKIISIEKRRRKELSS